jgi:hypothetical protein
LTDKDENAIKLLENHSIELFNQLNNLLDKSGQEILFSYDCTINKIYQLLRKTV